MEKKPVLLLTLFVFVCILAEDDKYSTKYDNFDVDAVISSPRLLKNYVNCAIEKGPCTPEGEELKRNIPDALQTDCSKCSDKQKQLTEKVLQYLMENELGYWEMLQNKYDPERKYTSQYLESKRNDTST